MALLEPRPILLATGLLCVAMPLVVLALLYRRHTRLNVVVWCLGGACMGVAAGLFALRDLAPDWLSLPVANLFAYAALFVRLPVLQKERGHRPRWGLSALMWLAASAQYLAAYGGGWPFEVRIGMNALIHLAGSLLIAWQAWHLARMLDSLGARMMVFGAVLYSLAQLVRAARVVSGHSDGIAISSEADFLALTAAAMLTSLTSNIGYLGMALDRARLKDISQHRALERLREQQLTLELAARERDAVRLERYRSSQVLAHEVRQPLHNAAVSLQAARSALERHDDVGDALLAVSQAQGVIGRVTVSLDNTVALASLLTGDGPLTRLEVDLEMLANLCVADLPPDARARVCIEHLADARSARMELGLVRLAVRNLLINATLYAPAGSLVHLRLLDSDDPLALVIEVADQGAGVPDDVLTSLVDPQGAAPHSVAPGHGLGLRIVQRVARLHGGSLAWRANDPVGSVFGLVLPQALPD